MFSKSFSYGVVKGRDCVVKTYKARKFRYATDYFFLQVMNEILFGMQVVKLYSWEDHFESKINRLRDAELKSLRGRKYLDAMCVYFWATTPVLISILTFTTYTLMGNQLTAAKVWFPNVHPLYLLWSCPKQQILDSQNAKHLQVTYITFVQMSLSSVVEK